VSILMVKLILLTKTFILVIVCGVVKWNEVRVYDMSEKKNKKYCIDILKVQLLWEKKNAKMIIKMRWCEYIVS